MMTTVDMEAASRGEETGTGEAEGGMGVVVGMIPEEVEGITGMEGMTGVEEMIGVVVDTVGAAAVVATVVEAETTEVVEEALEVEEIGKVVEAMVEAETTEAVVEGIEVVMDLGEVVPEEEEDLGLASEVMVVVVGTKKFHRRTRSSCRSKYGIDMVIQSYFALFIIELCFGKNSISKLCPPNV